MRSRSYRLALHLARTLAELLAAIGFAVFRRALHTWLADSGDPDLRTRLRDALPRVRAVLDTRPTGDR